MNAYKTWTIEQLADEADARLASVPGCAALPQVIHAAFPRWRLNPKRRAVLIETLVADDAMLAEVA